jgi:hypothetical protein
MKKITPFKFLCLLFQATAYIYLVFVKKGVISDSDIVMADPVTAAILIGGTLTAAATIQQGRIAEARGEAENEIAQFNAEQLDRQAKARIKASQIQEERVSREEKAFRGQQRAKFSKSLISINSETALDVLADTAFQFHIERNLTLRQGLVEGEQLRTQGVLLRSQGKLASQFGKAQKRQSILKAAGQFALSAGLASKAGGFKFGKSGLSTKIGARASATNSSVGGPIFAR